MSETTATVAPEKVDLDSIDNSMVEDKIEINPDVNPMEAPPPVADGIHRVKLTGAADWEQCETKPNRTSGESRGYFKTQFRGQVVSDDPKTNNKLVFGRENTLTFDGKNTMAYIMLQILGGNKVESAREFIKTLDTPLKLAKAFKEALAGEPIVKLSTKWIARYNAGTKEEPEYKTALSGMANFPKNPDGTYRHVFNLKGVGEVAAQAVIQDYFPDV
jgi:hypothetical protein